MPLEKVSQAHWDMLDAILQEPQPAGQREYRVMVARRDRPAHSCDADFYVRAESFEALHTIVNKCYPPDTFRIESIQHLYTFSV